MRWFDYALNLGAVGFVLSGSGAMAASFDCAKASKPIEKFICATPALSSLDEQLGRDYGRLLGEVPASLKPMIQKSQRSWLAYVPLNCSSDGRGAIKDKAQFTQCVQSEYEQRVGLLSKQPQTLGDYKLVVSADYQAMPSSSTDPEFFPIVTHSKSISIVFGGNEAEATKLNSWLQSLAAGNNAGWNDAEASVSFDVRITSVSAVIASATLSSDFFGVGAAHPVATSSSHHLVMATGKPLTARDLFQSNARSQLTTMVWNELKKKLGEDLMMEKKSDLAKLIDDPARWSFAADGMTWNFNVYEVAAYVMGPQDVTIPWSNLRAMLTPMGQSIADVAR